MYSWKTVITFAHVSLREPEKELRIKLRSDLVPAVCLPIDHLPKPFAGEISEGRRTFVFSQELSTACAAFAQQNGIHLEGVLLAGLNSLLMRYAGSLGEAPDWTFRKFLDGESLPADSAAVASVGFAGANGTVLNPDSDLVFGIETSAPTAVTGYWRFRRDVFEEETVTRIEQHYCSLLAELVAHPDQAISEPCLGSASEARQMQVNWNQTQTAYPGNSSIPELFEQVVAEHVDSVALLDGRLSLTYAELNERANALAAHLAGQGVEAGARVGLAMERSIAGVVSMLAVLKAGAAYVPLDASYPPERIRFMIADTEPAAILVDRKSPKALFAGSRLIDVEDLLPETSGGLGSRATAESAAYIMYTSGSTGTPKGVEILHRGIVRLVRNATYVDFGPREVFAQISNSSFDAITFEVWGALLNGARLVILPKEVVLSPEAFAAAIQQHGLTAMFLTSSLFNVMASKCPSAFRSVRHLMVGGDAVDPGWARHVLQTAPLDRIINGYGPTECTTFSVTHDIREVPAEAKSVPIGRPLSNSQAYVLDWHMRPVPAGIAGELYLGGDGLARGYWKRPELTAERFVPSPFDPTGQSKLYKTGDLARYRNDGVIEYLGRADHQVKIRGFRIELGEIETALRQHPKVTDCAVMVFSDALGNKSLAAYVATKHVPPPGSQEIRHYLRGRIPEFMVPSAFVFLEALPFSPNGKIDRRKLPRVEEAAKGSAKSRSVPMTEAQEIIATAWSKVLGTDGFGLDDNFFDIGGDSLRLAVVGSELQGRFSASLAMTDLFEHPTVRKLAVWLSGGPKQTNLRADAQERARRQRASVGGYRPSLRGA